MNTKLVGKWGEEQAAKYLQKRGMKLLSAGYRTRFGELDLVMEDRKTVVFVEVKLRRSDAFAPAMEHVDRHKQQRLRTTAELWLSQHDPEVSCRFDVVEVYAPEGEKGPVTIRHIENAFE